MKYELGLVDDHQLLSMALEIMLNDFKSFKVTLLASNGLELQEKLPAMMRLPDIILVDVSMPGMSGVEVTSWLHEQYPAIKLAALTTDDSTKAVAAMMRAGCNSYLLKNIHPMEFEIALLRIAERGFYNTDVANINFRNIFDPQNENVFLTEREKEFLKLACSDDTYKQIARKMSISKSTVDGYRQSLFQKLNVESRTGMVLEAVRRKIIVL